MTKPAVEVRDIGKRYYIGSNGGTRESLNDYLSRIVREPIRRLASLSQDRPPTHAECEFWALRNVSFDISRGEALGLVGPNGSGKSTLLKIIANVVRPSEGYTITRGRVGSLLEVSAGFHPELTGRENAYLKAAVMGMTRHEVDDHWQEIIDFAEIHDFIDTPIKRYSSGMEVRLGFAVAAKMRPEILLVDEAFAVGDQAFREKCIAEIEQIVQEDTTVIIVSHQPEHIRRLCSRLVWLEGGTVYEQGPTETFDSWA